MSDPASHSEKPHTQQHLRNTPDSAGEEILQRPLQSPLILNLMLDLGHVVSRACIVVADTKFHRYFNARCEMCILLLLFPRNAKCELHSRAHNRCR